MFAPSKTPAPVINRLNQETARVINNAEIKERFFNAGVETAGSSPEEFATMIKSDISRWDKVIKEAGIRED